MFWDGSDAQPCFYPKGNCIYGFSSRNLIFALGSRDTLPFISSVPLNWTVWGQWIFPLDVIMLYWCTIDQPGYTLIQNNISSGQVTGRLFSSKKHCLPLCWSIVGVCFRVYSKEEGQEGPFPRHRASRSAGRLTNTRRAVPSSQHRNCLLTRWENHPSRGQNNH